MTDKKSNEGIESSLSDVEVLSSSKNGDVLVGESVEISSPVDVDGEYHRSFSARQIHVRFIHFKLFSLKTDKHRLYLLAARSGQDCSSRQARF